MSDTPNPLRMYDFATAKLEYLKYNGFKFTRISDGKQYYYYNIKKTDKVGSSTKQSDETSIEESKIYNQDTFIHNNIGFVTTNYVPPHAFNIQPSKYVSIDDEEMILTYDSDCFEIKAGRKRNNKSSRRRIKKYTKHRRTRYSS